MVINEKSFLRVVCKLWKLLTYSSSMMFLYCSFHLFPFIVYSVVLEDLSSFFFLF